MDSPKQEAVLATDGERVQVILRTHFRPQTRDLAWVVPVPGKPTDVAPVWSRVFDRLDEAYRPKFLKATFSPGTGIPFGCSAEQGQLSTEKVPVRVEKTGTAGMFNYSVLSASRADELAQWLNGHGYRMPPNAKDVLARYVDKGWYWLAMQVRPEASDQAVHAPHPISYIYRGNMVFPLVISQLSAAAENEIILYTVGKSGYRCVGWPEVELQDSRAWGELRLSSAWPSGTTYEPTARKMAADKGGGMFVVEFCSPEFAFGRGPDTRCRLVEILDGSLADALSETQHLTRLRGFVSAEAMTRDVHLRAAEGRHRVHNEVLLYNAMPEESASQPAVGKNAGSAMGFLPLPLICAGSLLWGPRRRRRAAGAALLTAGLLMLVL